MRAVLIADIEKELAIASPLDSYRFIRKQEYFNKFKLLGAVERCFGWNDRLCGMQFRACCLAVVL